MAFESQIVEALQALESSGLRRFPKQISGLQGPEILVDGKPCVCLCSNNYLGLAAHPALSEAARAASFGEGVGAASSRLITGTMDAHEEAERRLAEYVGTEDAAIFSSGYAANVGTIQALVGPGDLVLSDALNHASLIDGCRLSRAKVKVFAHGDPDHLEDLLREHRGAAERALIVSDSLFSMDGDLAPVQALRMLADRYEAGLLLDEAHALGVLGPSGRGVSLRAGVRADLLVGTLGKAFGVSGAFVGARRELVDFIRNRARSFVFSTAPPPMLLRSSLAALELVREADDARAKLLRHATCLRRELRALGYEVPDGETHILPVLIGNNERTMELSAELLRRGVFVQGIRPPTVPTGSARLRLTPMATHRKTHIDRAIDAFAALAPKA
jgi:8-amino-7-oxononanoate synthase